MVCMEPVKDRQHTYTCASENRLISLFRGIYQVVTTQYDTTLLPVLILYQCTTTMWVACESPFSWTGHVLPAECNRKDSFFCGLEAKHCMWTAPSGAFCSLKREKHASTTCFNVSQTRRINEPSGVDLKNSKCDFTQCQDHCFINTPKFTFGLIFMHFYQ